MTETPRTHINEDILGLSEVEAPYAPTGIKENVVDGYTRNITTAVDTKNDNTYHHNSIREAEIDAPPKHPIESMTKVIGINPPAGVPIDGEEPGPEPWVVPEDAVFYSEEYVLGTYTFIPHPLYSQAEMRKYLDASISNDISDTYIEFPTFIYNVDGKTYTVTNSSEIVAHSEHSCDYTDSNDNEEGMYVRIAEETDAETGDYGYFHSLTNLSPDTEPHKVWIKIDNIGQDNWNPLLTQEEI